MSNMHPVEKKMSKMSKNCEVKKQSAKTSNKFLCRKLKQAGKYKLHSKVQIEGDPCKFFSPCVEDCCDDFSELYPSNKSMQATQVQFSSDKDNGMCARKRKRNSTPFERPLKMTKIEPNSAENKLVGYESTMDEVMEVLLHMKHPEIYKKFKAEPSHGILLHGPPGCGKTMMASAIAKELDLPLVKSAATDLISDLAGGSETNIRNLFKKAQAKAPCILFIDEIDAISPKRESKDSAERGVVNQLITSMNELSSRKSDVFVVGATNFPETLDPALRCPGRFDREVRVAIPNEESRLMILEQFCHKLPLHPNVDLSLLAKNTPGFVGADLKALVSGALVLAIKRVFEPLKNNEEKDDKTKTFRALFDHPPLNADQLNSCCVEYTDFETVLKKIQPSTKRQGFATIPDVTWNDIGGLEEIRKKLKLAITVPITHPELTKQVKLKKSSGVLLFGPPGCGKTLIAKAIANEPGLNFISIKASELLNMYVGETERGIRECFTRARDTAPSVIFFDEIDCICQKRTGDFQSNTSAINQLLVEMDGFDSRDNVIIIGATNRPDLMDSASIRPGRFETMIYVDLPSAEGRLDILRKMTQNGTYPRLSNEISLRDIARDHRCRRFTGADLSKLVNEAAKRFVEEVVDQSPNIPVCIGREHFEYAFNQTKPSVSKKDYDMYQRSRALFDP